MTSVPLSKKAPVGRPSRLCKEDILNAALTLGLDDLTMNSLAQHLDIGVSSIYYYFKNRKDLIRAAAAYSFQSMAYPVDNGEYWGDLVINYVQSIRDNLVANASFIYGHQFSDLGFDVHFELLDRFLGSMHQRGFNRPDSMALMNSMAMAAFGSAVEIIRRQDFLNGGDSMEAAASRQFERHKPYKFKHIQGSLNVFTASPQTKLNQLLRPIMEDFARRNKRDLAKVAALFNSAV